ncbi:hypothetical protein BGZ73_003817 [Actinomortierella ambigua]|nr:hypothetical protein BGZ73_003817 [Actinomortierella ambigua]
MFVRGARLGVGSFGQVHQALYGDQPCAAKSFFLSQPGLDRKIIQKEIEVLQKLRYRHIIQFYRTHEEGDRIYLLMELAEKGSLEHAIAKGEIAHDDWTTKRRLAHEIARGLAYIHQEKVLHRDLKSANVLLTKNMEVRLADFGLAQVRSAVEAASSGGSQSSGRPAGTLRWVAPELLFVSAPKYSAKSDVYALGVVMWEIAADCTRPFKQDNEMLVTHSVKEGRREHLPEDTPADYRQWVERCWDQVPDRRPNARDVVLVNSEATDENSSRSSSMADSFVDLGSTGASRPWSYPHSHHGDPIHRPHTMVATAHDDNNNSNISRFPETDDEVVAYFCAAAQRESADAQLFLAWIFCHGRDIEQNEQNSLWWYRQAAERGNVVAQLRVARMFEAGQGVEASDDAKAARWYRKAADSGSAEAGLALAKMYTEGRGVKEDAVQAAQWYRMAAEQGLVEAQVILGQWYSLGRGVIQSDIEAARWLMKAAESGDATAQKSLGKMYLQGRGVQLYDVSETKWYTKIAGRMRRDQRERTVQSDVEAFKWYTQAAEQGDSDAQLHLGLMYDKGRGVEQNEAEAIKWYTRAAEQGNTEAQYNVGQAYRYGLGVRQSDAEAIKWYTKPAEEGKVDAQFNLGWMHSFGRGVEQNHAEAAKWYTRAADQGNMSAQYILAQMYRLGIGVQKSDVEAFKWYSRAAEQGNTDAQYNLGYMFQFGHGVEQCKAEAVKWYSKVAERGNADLQYFIAEAYRLGEGVEQSDVEAFKWYSRAAEQGKAEAQYKLAQMYRSGRKAKQGDMDAFK